jgi:hypothetical protein
MSRGVHELRERRRARRWQRQMEVDPLDDYAHRFRSGAAAAALLFLAVIVLVVVGFVIAR